MASEVSICNLALDALGKQRISDLDEGSVESKACKAHYPQARDELLELYPWRFARTTVALAEVSNAKAERWEYAYQRPADCIRPWVLHDAALADYIASGASIVDGRGGLVVAGNHAFAIEGQTIYCDISPAYLTFTARVTDPTKFGPLFVQALADRLAWKIAFPLTRDLNVRKDAYQLAQVSRTEAEVADANAVPETSDRPSELIEARG